VLTIILTGKLKKYKIHYMKLIFFLIALCLLSIRIYFSWFDKGWGNRGESTSNMVIKGDHFYEEIKYRGKFQLTDDETGFKTISPGGYFKFIKNEKSVQAESNLKGEIDYRISDGKDYLATDEQGKKLIAEAVKEMIYQGFDANARMERLYQKGGRQALISEIDSMRISPLKVLYLNRLFTIDSLSPADMALITKKIESLGSDLDEAQFLNKISYAQMKNPLTANAYFEIANSLNSDLDKSGALQHIIDQDSVTEENTNKILNSSRGMGSDLEKANLYNKMIDKRLITGPRFDSLLDLISHMGSDMDKANLYNKMIDKGLITGAHFDSLLDPISQMGSDLDKVNLYIKLTDEKNLSEAQWMRLTDKTAGLGSDMDKANLLIAIAQRMPKTEICKVSYMKAAKTLGNDSDYGRAVRAVE
jgi:uncharacterized protein YjbI with pentapeptide repeats